MKRSTDPANRVLYCEALGFAAIIAISWANEYFDVPGIIFGRPSAVNWHEAFIETLVVLVVAVPTMLLTHRMVARLFHIEGFLRMCAWCRQVDLDGSWVPIEQFFQKGFGTHTSHSICPACVAKEEHELRARTKAT